MTRKKTLKTFVKELIDIPEFSEAWEELGTAGIGSRVAANKIHRLLCKSKWHARILNQVSLEALQQAGDWADQSPSQELVGSFHTYLLRELSTIAAGYMLQGITIGAYVTMLRVEKPEANGEGRQDSSQNDQGVEVRP